MTAAQNDASLAVVLLRSWTPVFAEYSVKLKLESEWKKSGKIIG